MPPDDPPDDTRDPEETEQSTHVYIPVSESVLDQWRETGDLWIPLPDHSDRPVLVHLDIDDHDNGGSDFRIDDALY